MLAAALNRRRGVAHDYEIIGMWPIQVWRNSADTSVGKDISSNGNGVKPLPSLSKWRLPSTPPRRGPLFPPLIGQSGRQWNSKP